MKDFTIGQVCNGVIKHSDNYYGSRIDQASINLLLRGDEFSAFSRDTVVSITAIIVFQSNGIRISLLSYFVLIACLIFTVVLVPPVPREFINRKSAVFHARK